MSLGGNFLGKNKLLPKVHLLPKVKTQNQRLRKEVKTDEAFQET
jgi:hypothetical protein